MRPKAKSVSRDLCVNPQDRMRKKRFEIRLSVLGVSYKANQQAKSRQWTQAILLLAEKLPIAYSTLLLTFCHSEQLVEIFGVILSVSCESS